MRTVVPAFGRQVRRALAVGVLAGATILASAPAVQAEPPQNGIAKVLAIPGARPATSASDGVTALSKCAVTAYGYTGYRICEFDWLSVTKSNGSVEYFVVGTNYAVFHIWPGSGGWKSLGGRARTATPNGVYYLTVSGPDYGVATIGTDNRTWCTINSSGRWSNWFAC